jgi:serine/threonine protein kinase
VPAASADRPVCPSLQASCALPRTAGWGQGPPPAPQQFRVTMVESYQRDVPKSRHCKLLGAPMEVERFLRLAVGVAMALGKLHQRGLVHKDIKPANIILNEATGEVRLTGFGIAPRLSRERQAAKPPEALNGTFAYMAPEQTGRLNRSIDSRSDLYALGVT